jgi:hypothetical protein
VKNKHFSIEKEKCAATDRCELECRTESLCSGGLSSSSWQMVTDIFDDKCSGHLRNVVGWPDCNNSVKIVHFRTGISPETDTTGR